MKEKRYTWDSFCSCEALIQVRSADMWGISSGEYALGSSVHEGQDWIFHLSACVYLGLTRIIVFYLKIPNLITSAKSSFLCKVGNMFRVSEK